MRTTPAAAAALALSLALLLSPAARGATGPPPTAPRDDAPLRVHIISGSKEYASEQSLKGFKEDLERRYHVTVTASWGQDEGKSLDNLQDLAKAEVLLLFARRMTLPEEQMKLIRAHWEAGRPIVGVRTASHAFSDAENEVFDRQVLGGAHRSHGGDEPVRVTNEPAQVKHPILRGVGPITSSHKLYRRNDLADGVVVLQTGANDKERQPVTMTHTYRGGRVFYTSLGVPEDFKDENFRRLLTNAIFWTTHRDPERMKQAR